MIVLIPAYEPDQRLVDLVADLRAAAPQVHVVVVDDGSGPGYRHVFDAVRGPGCTVLVHSANRGKGAALKTGFRHIEAAHAGHDVVCADSDGQHTVADILRVAGHLEASGAREAMVMGSRGFTGPVPARSVVGNRATGALFHLATGLRLADTQTGLRGYPAAMLPWLRTVPGDRFEYELTLLLRAAEEGIGVEEVEIATVYLQHNESSHFRPVRDSLRVLTPLLRFSLASLAAFAVDTVALLVLHASTGSLLASVVGARLISATTNYLVNRRLVFARGRHSPLGASALRYGLLAALLLAASYGALHLLTGLGLALLPAKVLTEAALYVASFQVQRRLVFTPRRSSSVPDPTSRASTGPDAASLDQPRPYPAHLPHR